MLASNVDRSPSNRPAPLRGIRVLDLTTVLAGPYSTYQLALLGADVIKLEKPEEGDWARQGAPALSAPDLSAQFVAQNAGKRSITVNLKSPEGVRQVLELIDTCDVLVENFAPGVAARLGLGFEAVKSRKPNIVYCSISGYGQDGPMSARPAYDHVVQAASGITMLTGTSATVPNRIGPPIVDYLAGIYGAFSVLAALRERDQTGQAQYLDVAMLDTAIVAMASTVSVLNNGGIQPQANGNTAASGSPMSGIFPTADGLLAMTANNDRQFERVMQELGLHDALNDERFSTSQARHHHVNALQALLVEHLSGASAQEWEQRLSAAHVPVARVRELHEILSEPHIQSRGVQQPVFDPVSGASLYAPSIGFKWNGQALGPLTPAPRLGEHTNDVLGAFNNSIA
ncbi:CaiB/BaiF CoA transferase family protein [Alcaligenes sp. SDU_A2]|uniref:CaiB/BaiF CoA transferase family protein n=1 Tax=Alcaligenes sp. SDU_A2 TaxID=3136634 RepID=UPI00311FB857